MFAESFSHGIKTFTCERGVEMNPKLSAIIGVEKTVVVHGFVNVIGNVAVPYGTAE